MRERGVAAGGDVELRSVAVRPAGGRLLLGRLVQERPAAPSPPVPALAGAVRGAAVVVAEAVHADPRGRRRAGLGATATAARGRPRRLLQAPERALLLRPPALLPERLHLLLGQRPVPPRVN